MAEVSVDPENKNPLELFNQGVRAYSLRDYPTAVQALSLATELLVSKHGDDKHESLGEVYLYYGKALLDLSREETEPLGDAVTKTINEEDSDDDEEDAAPEEPEEDAKVNGEEATEEEKPVNGEAGPSTSGEQKESEEEEPTDLQLAWEVLELAKLILEKQGDASKSMLADTFVTLGEVSLENENFAAAVEDIKSGLNILESLEEKNDRVLAETYYKLGMAFSTNSQMDDAVKSFNSSLNLLKERIKKLQEKDPEAYKEEIEEMKGLIPEIEEKIADTQNSKDEVHICQCLKDSSL